MRVYEKPEAEIVTLGDEDVIVASAVSDCEVVFTPIEQCPGDEIEIY